MLKKISKILLLTLLVLSLSCESNNDVLELENNIENSDETVELKKESSKELASIESMYNVNIRLVDYFPLPGPNPSPDPDLGVKFLSTTRKGDIVDLYPIDDNSGRQKWNIIKKMDFGVPYYHIMISGGVRGSKRYLSSTNNGGKIDLHNRDDGSGRQRWIITNGEAGTKIIKIFAGITPANKRLLVRHRVGNNHTNHVELNGDFGVGRYYTWLFLPTFN